MHSLTTKAARQADLLAPQALAGEQERGKLDLAADDSATRDNAPKSRVSGAEPWTTRCMEVGGRALSRAHAANSRPYHPTPLTGLWPMARQSDTLADCRATSSWRPGLNGKAAEK